MCMQCVVCVCVMCVCIQCEGTMDKQEDDSVPGDFVVIESGFQKNPAELDNVESSNIFS